MRIARDVSMIGIKIVAKASAIVVTPVFGIATDMQFLVKLSCIVDMWQVLLYIVCNKH